jgi:uncharacterized membrane protein (UPF0127 family)
VNKTSMAWGKGRAWILAAGAFAMAAGAGCTRETPIRSEPGDVITLEIKGKKVEAEVACDVLSRQKGLMSRPSLPENDGMIFLFRERDTHGFWMKNTIVPLSVAFIDESGKILQIEDMKPHDESSTRSKHPVRYALEVNQGWFQKNGIGVGDSFADLPAKVRAFRAL